jgi:hypothetical protein
MTKGRENKDGSESILKQQGSKLLLNYMKSYFLERQTFEGFTGGLKTKISKQFS